MDRVFLGKLHKVVVGPNPGDRQSAGYTLGSPIDRVHPNITVALIELDENLYQKYGKIACVVWAKDSNKSGNEIFIYKTFLDVPITLSSAID